ncbi:MAG: T9SS type A sorting domain-containing protein [Lewinella sp.]|nr:T9SS type A sorting domain-containing protein [Lewinella sp.]
MASIDSIRLMTGVRRKRIVFSRLPGWEYDNDIWIEGIGGSRGLLGSRYLPKRPSGPFVNITCVFDNRELLEYDYWDSEAVSSAGAFLDCEQDLHVPPEEEYTVNRALEIFPNPTYTNYVTLKSSFLLSDIKSVKLYNHLGQLMEEIPITSKNGTYFFSDISLRDEQAGIYIIVMEVASHGRVAGKILKL